MVSAMEWAFRGSEAVLAVFFAYMARWLYLKGLRCDKQGERYDLGQRLYQIAIDQLSAEKYGTPEEVEALVARFQGLERELKEKDLECQILRRRKPFKWV